jgi:chromosome segregation ATPase
MQGEMPEMNCFVVTKDEQDAAGVRGDECGARQEEERVYIDCRSRSPTRLNEIGKRARGEQETSSHNNHSPHPWRKHQKRAEHEEGNMVGHHTTKRPGETRKRTQQADVQTTTAILREAKRRTGEAESRAQEAEQAMRLSEQKARVMEESLLKEGQKAEKKAEHRRLQLKQAEGKANFYEKATRAAEDTARKAEKRAQQAEQMANQQAEEKFGNPEARERSTRIMEFEYLTDVAELESTVGVLTEKLVSMTRRIKQYEVEADSRKKQVKGLHEALLQRDELLTESEEEAEMFYELGEERLKALKTRQAELTKEAALVETDLKNQLEQARTKAKEKLKEHASKMKATRRQLDHVLLKMECAVCFETKKDSTVLLPCCHSFCGACVTECLKRDDGTIKEGASCPICRALTFTAKRLF